MIWRARESFFTFSGGEIFLRPDLYEIWPPRGGDFDISLKSNALLVTAGRAAKLREFGVRRVQSAFIATFPRSRRHHKSAGIARKNLGRDSDFARA